MTSSQEVKLSMYNAVLAHCKQNETIIAAIPALQTAITDLRTTATAIQLAVQQQLQTTKGHTAGKTANRQMLINLGTQVAGAIYAWATDKKNLLVMEKTKTTASALLRLRDEELAPACREYYDIGVANETALVEYGITTTVIDEFSAAIEAYATTVPAPRNAQSIRTAYKKSMVDLFKKADTILKSKIDRLSLPLKKINKAFMDAYTSNRAIMDAGTTTTQLRVNVADKEGAPLKGAVIAIEALGYSAPTTSKGDLLIKPILQGTYKISILLEGYQPVQLDEIKILRGQVNTQQVTLRAA